VNPETPAEVFTDAIVAAEQHRRPHQIQRTIRAAIRGGMREVAADAEVALQTDTLATGNRNRK